MIKNIFITLLLFTFLSKLNLTDGFCQADTCTDLECCDCYKNYQCSDDQHIKKEYDLSCGEDIAKDTLRIIELGETEIEWTENGEAIMFIGLTGQGKSTLTYFLADRKDQMFGIKGNSPGKYLIKDCTGKISDPNQTINSETLFPDLIKDMEINLYDNPGFKDTRSDCIEIAKSYFMHKVVSNLKTVKFVLVINFSSLESGQDRKGLSELLENVVSFIPLVENYGNSISLVATKSVFFPGSTVEEYVETARNFLELALVDLKNNSESEKKRFILESLLNNKNRISIFFAPSECGILSKMNLMTDTKDLIRENIHNFSSFSEKKGEFGHSISESTLLKINDIFNSLEYETRLLLKEFTTYLTNSLDIDCIILQNCSSYSSQLTFLSQQEDIINEYSDIEKFKSMTITDIAIYLLEINFPYFIKPFSLIENIISNSNKLDFFKQIRNEISFDFTIWLLDFKSFSKNVNLFKKYESDYDFLTKSLQRDLSTKDFQLDQNFASFFQLYRNMSTVDDFVVNYENFQELNSFTRPLDELKLAISTRTSQKLEEINSIFNFFLHDDFSCTSFSNDSELNCIGKIGRISRVDKNINENHTNLFISAYHTFFFDKEFKFDNFLNVSIIATTVSIEKPSINFDLKGFEGASFSYDDKGDKPGKPGGNGGNLIIYSNASIDGILNINLSGGKGGNGQNGKAGEPGRNGVAYDSSEVVEDGNCGAWVGGWVQCYIFGSKCHTDKNEDHPNRCKAGDDGAYHTVPGKVGSPGGKGGNGGVQGFGGNKGSIYINIQGKKDNLLYTSVDGELGNLGIGGDGGRGGNTGATWNGNIDDVSAGNKECGYKHVGNPTPSTEYASDGQKGVDGGGSEADRQSPDYNYFSEDFSADQKNDFLEESRKIILKNQWIYSYIESFQNYIQTI